MVHSNTYVQCTNHVNCTQVCTLYIFPYIVLLYYNVQRYKYISSCTSEFLALLKCNSNCTSSFQALQFFLNQYVSRFTSTFKALQVQFQSYKYTFSFASTLLALLVYFQPYTYTFSFTSTFITLQVQVYKYYQFISSLTSTFLSLQIHFQLYKYSSSFTSSLLALQVHFQLYKHNSSFTFYKLNLLLFKNTSNFLRCVYILVEKTEWFNVRRILRGEGKGSTVIY